MTLRLLRDRTTGYRLVMEPYRIRLSLTPSHAPSLRGGRYDVELVDEQPARMPARAAGVAFLDLQAQPIEGLRCSAGELLATWQRGAGTTDERSQLGRHLLDRLLGDQEVRALWDEIGQRAAADGRPLRLELRLPADRADVVCHLPFDLLADERGGVFERPGATLVRRRHRRSSDRPVSKHAATALAQAAAARQAAEPTPAGETQGAPWSWTPFLAGRYCEFDRVLAYLRSSRVVNVIGPPGMGRTAVARAIAARCATIAAERVLRVALDGISCAEDACPRIGLALRLDPGDCHFDLWMTMAMRRKLGNTRLVLVLDNVEQAIRSDEEMMPMLAEMMLRSCPGLHLVLNTDAPLPRMWEMLDILLGVKIAEVPLRPLRKADARAMFIAAAGERLQAAEHSDKALDSILAQLDGHSRAIVLLAKQVGTLPLASLREQLRLHAADPTHAVSSLGDSAGSPLPPALAASLSVAYQALAAHAPAAAEMFAWMGYFPAGLAGLVLLRVFGAQAEALRASLLRQGLAEEYGWEQRLTIPASLRAFARHRAATLPAQRRLELLQASLYAMAEWLMALAIDADEPPAREAAETALRDGENLKALLQMASASHAGDIETLAPALLAMVLAWVTQVVRHMHLVKRLRPVLGAVSALIASSPSSPTLAEALARLNAIDVYLANHPSETDPLTRSGAGGLFAMAKLIAGRRNLERPASARPTGYQDALARLARPAQHSIEDPQKQPCPPVQSTVHDEAGETALARNQPVEAFRCYLAALQAHHACGNQQGVAAAHIHLGRAALAAHRAARAAALLAVGVTLYEHLDSSLDRSQGLITLAQAFTALQQEEAATAALRLACAHAAAIDSPLATPLGARVGSTVPPSEDQVHAAQVLVNTTLAMHTDDLRARGEDLYAPLEPEPAYGPPPPLA